MSKSESKRGRATVASGAGGVAGATGAGPIDGGAPQAGGSPGADGIPAPRAPAPGGFPAFATHAAATSEWMYSSQGGFMNMLQSPKVPFMNYPNGSQLPQNYHLVGGIMGHSTTSPTTEGSQGTPSPTGSSANVAAQIGSQDKETIEVEDNDTIQPARSNARSNARSIATSIARADRRLSWSNEEDIRLLVLGYTIQLTR